MAGMLTLDEINARILTPALQLLPPAMDTPAARVMLLTITQQEDHAQRRVQLLADGGDGPARGLWQFERMGGVRGVLNHGATAHYAQAVCIARSVTAEAGAVWRNLSTDDLLACAFARLLLWSDPQPLARNNRDGWALYARTWRPGKPKPETWPDYYAQARALVVG